MIQATEAAIKQIKNELENLTEDVKNPYIRLSMALGWGGPRLQLALEESTHKNDEVKEIDGIKFVIHKNQAPYFNQVKLDYTKNMFGIGEYTLLRV